MCNYLTERIKGKCISFETDVHLALSWHCAPSFKAVWPLCLPHNCHMKYYGKWFALKMTKIITCCSFNVVHSPHWCLKYSFQLWISSLTGTKCLKYEKNLLTLKLNLSDPQVCCASVRGFRTLCRCLTFLAPLPLVAGSSLCSGAEVLFDKRSWKAWHTEESSPLPALWTSKLCGQSDVGRGSEKTWTIKKKDPTFPHTGNLICGFICGEGSDLSELLGKNKSFERHTGISIWLNLSEKTN